MRNFMVAMIIVGLTVPASAQGMSGGKRHRGNPEKTDQQKRKVDEKAYQSVLDKVSDKKFDPWQSVRQPPSPK